MRDRFLNIPRPLGFLLALFVASAVSAQALSHRQSNLTVQVTNLTNAPLPGASVKVEMINHDFRFGTAIVYGELYAGNAEYSLQGLDALQTYR